MGIDEPKKPKREVPDLKQLVGSRTLKEFTNDKLATQNMLVKWWLTLPEQENRDESVEIRRIQDEQRKSKQVREGRASVDTDEKLKEKILKFEWVNKYAQRLHNLLREDETAFKMNLRALQRILDERGDELDAMGNLP
jgi:hypothetical protein